MRLIYINVLLSLLVLTSGCASNNFSKPSFPILTKAWSSSRAALDKVRSGCKLCGHKSVGPSVAAIEPSGPVFDQPCPCEQPIYSVPEPAVDACNCGDALPLAEVMPLPLAVEGCDSCNQSQEVISQPPPIHEGYEVLQYSDGVPAQREIPIEGISLAEPPVPQGTTPLLETSPGTDWDPVVQPQDHNLEVVSPELETPKIEAVPYVEPRLKSAPEADGAGVLELDDEEGFLSAKSLTQDESAEADQEPEEAAEAVEDPSDFDSVLGPTEAELAQKNILERATDTGPVVLKARPVANHRVNDRRSLERSVFKASNQTDVYGLPTDRSVQFSELPPMDFGTRPRPASFQRNEAPPAAPPAKHIEALDVEALDVEDKTTQLESQDMQVVESTTKVPTDAEPMLRMTAIPYSGSSTLGAAIARIKVGKTPLIVRGEYPRDVEYERLARERNEQSTRSVIIPNDSLKTIDR